MNRPLPFVLIPFCVVLLTLKPAAAQSLVELKQNDGRHHLLYNSQPYRINGVGGHTYLKELVAAGGNSIRTWGAEQLEAVLPAAVENGLTVCAGLWLGHERHGFNYGDPAAVEKQLQESLEAVRRYKDHPALLIWGVGNEMEGDGTNPAIWKAVNEVARQIKQIDPNHPTMTVIAELGEGEVKLQNLDRYCPDIDIVGVNSYGGILTMAERYRRTGVLKPYIVTEFGPVGPWETAKTAWGAPLEPTSTEKAAAFSAGYNSAVAQQSDICLGSYAFLWGHKQETTATWFGMLLPDGSRLGAVDAMSEAWTGRQPANRSPLMTKLKLDQSQNLKPGAEMTAEVKVSDPENDEVEIKWVLRRDSRIIGEGGDAQQQEATINASIKSTNNIATFSVPEQTGAYRLFAYAYDRQGGAAVANVPFYAGGPTIHSEPAGPAKILPFAVYSDNSTPTIYVPSGYMGNAAAIKMDVDCRDAPFKGATCIRVDYTAGGNWGGVLWQSPANDWEGKQPGGANLTGATQLEFRAKGAQGGETVNFVFGVLDGYHAYRDTAKGELKNVKLTSSWEKYTMPLKGLDLTRIKTAFGWSLAGQGQPVTFYLDEIRYVR